MEEYHRKEASTEDARMMAASRAVSCSLEPSVASYCCHKTLTDLKTKGLQVTVSHLGTSFGDTKAGTQNRTWLKWARIWRRKLNKGRGEVLLQHPGPTRCLAVRPLTHSKLSSVNQENDPQACLGPIWWEHFLNWGSLLSNGTGLCQADKNNNNKDNNNKCPIQQASLHVRAVCLSRINRWPVKDRKHQTSHTLSKCAISLWEERGEWQEWSGPTVAPFLKAPIYRREKHQGHLTCYVWTW